ncbi:hypothetical protein CH371_19965 [Leptospira wolffii]|uniref:Uncharacterized protein n=1 Tax=Leptospira wolffii TaxID=409998 RepID=A0A2M9Z6R7_9LEPT|nr:hypothetical protein CH371_19965 [Leptospira wolffii]
MAFGTFRFVTRLAGQVSRQVLTDSRNVVKPWSLSKIPPEFVFIFLEARKCVDSFAKHSKSCSFRALPNVSWCRCQGIASWYLCALRKLMFTFDPIPKGERDLSVLVNLAAIGLLSR